MKVFATVSAIFCAVFYINAQDLPNPPLSGSCDKVAVRKDIRRMTSNEWDDYAKAIQDMHQLGWLEGLARIHDQYAMEIHGCGFFFPWHRRFVTHFQKLLNMINPNVVVPYWDWTAEWQNPETDPILSSQRFGGNGVGENQCVVDGIEANWNRTFPDFNCMSRNYQQGSSTGPFWPMDGIVRLVNNDQDYRTYSNNIENGCHGAVHLGVGGDFKEMWAPNDALFFGHHGMVDRLWAIWQVRNPNGFSDINSQAKDGETITLDSPLPFYGDTVGSLMRFNGPGHCYAYDDLADSFFGSSQRVSAGVPNRFYGVNLKYPRVNTTEPSMWVPNPEVAENMNVFIKSVVDDIKSSPYL